MPTEPTRTVPDALIASDIERARAALAETRPSQIGPYHVLELLGSGGMGEVYKAEQRTPIRRTVAIKIIKLGCDTREIIARFESERQALARMDHPHVARVLDAGVSDVGQPYFVMEHVPGVPITKFCDDNKLSIKDRLLLFTQVCDAIAHAHTKAIIHRDIKAGNVLAYLHDGKPTVKVIDFGIAKALTGDRLTDGTFNTMRGDVIGTYEYMSPEQADGSPDIDTRTDVYSLGVLLYELLTGARPFDSASLAKAAHEEIRRIIREVEPPRPSTRLSSLGQRATGLAAARQAKLDVLARQLRSELEWIPLKAMRKERVRRYDSPLALKRDIEDYLEGKPLLAGPESRVYHLRKFTRRHAAGIATAAAILGMLVTGVSIYVHSIRAEQARTRAALLEAERQQAEAQRQAREAKTQSEIATAVSDFLSNRVLSGATPARLPDKQVRDAIVKAMLDPAAASVEKDFEGKPLTEAAVRSSIAESFYAVGRADLATPHTERALALRRRVLGDDHPETLQSINAMGHLLHSQGRAAEAEPLVREALERSRRALGNDHPLTLASINNMSALLQTQGKFTEAEPFVREALERRRRVMGDDDPGTLKAINNTGHFLESRGKLAEAESLLREALERSRRVLGDDHPETVLRLSGLAYLLQSRGRLVEAEPLHRQALERSRSVLGDDHPDTMQSINNMGIVLQEQGKLVEAEPLFREALGRRRRVLGEDHPTTLKSINNMAALLLSQGKLGEAELLFREALERRRRVLGDDHPDTRIAMNNLAALLEAQKRFGEAEPLIRAALERNRRLLGDDHPNTLSSLGNAAAILKSQGKLAEAEPLYREALERRRRTLGDDHPDTLTSVSNLATLLQEQGKLAEAEPLVREALERRRRVLGEDHPDTLIALASMGMLRFRQGKPTDAEPLIREAVTRATTNPSLGSKHPRTKQFALSDATCLDALGRHDDAAAVRKEFGLPEPATRPSTEPATVPAPTR